MFSNLRVHNMGFHNRKLLPDSINKTDSDSDLISICISSCDPSNESGYCLSRCLTLCPDICHSSIPPPSHPDFSSDDDHHPDKTQKILIITLSILAASFILLCCYAIYVKYYSSWYRSRRRSRSQPQTDETHDDFLDEDHGPVVDHPIWYIQTVGLQPSIISSIAAVKYKRGDGLVEGTDCSVCLNEFQEDETLRLLPKCSHAFHIPCIDTWLRSHTNCPVCRAPIVASAAAASSSEGNIDSSGSLEETRVRVLEDNGETEREMEDGIYEMRTGENEEERVVDDENGRKRGEILDEQMDEIQPMRRSVSLDSLSASKINETLASVLQGESDGNSDSKSVERRESNMRIVPKRVGGNQCLLRLVGTASIGRSIKNGPISLKRSFSCSGKFLLSRCSF